MSNDKAWDDSEVSAAANYSAVHIGLDADPKVIRRFIDGKLTSVRTAEPGLTMDLLGELAGKSIVADDVISMSFEMDSARVVVTVNDRLVVLGKRSPDGGCEWWAAQENDAQA